MTLNSIKIALTLWCALLAGLAQAKHDYKDMAWELELPIDTPNPEAFSFCYKHSCNEIIQTGLTAQEWQFAVNLMAKPAKNAEQERKHLAQTIAWFEQAIGPKTNTADDRGGNLSGFRANSIQLDCIDESTNTTTYLTLLEKAGLLKFHRVADRKTRGFMIFGWPHTTASIEEIQTGKRWAVDSWFRDNGSEPDILPIETWSDGWTPEGF